MNIGALRLGGAFARILMRCVVAGATVALISSAARAEQAAVEVVRQYQAALLAAMRQGGGFEGRYRALQGPVVKAFDLGFIAQRAAGPDFAKFTEPQKKRYFDAFARYSVSQHASRFKKFAGERFEVLGSDDVGRGFLRVRTHIVTSSGEKVSLDYLMGQRAGGWRIVDVFAKGAISEVATRRADFAPVIRSQGAEGLIRALEDKAAQARSS